MTAVPEPCACTHCSSGAFYERRRIPVLLMVWYQVLLGETYSLHAKYPAMQSIQSRMVNPTKPCGGTVLARNKSDRVLVGIIGFVSWASCNKYTDAPNHLRKIGALLLNLGLGAIAIPFICESTINRVHRRKATLVVTPSNSIAHGLLREGYNISTAGRLRTSSAGIYTFIVAQLRNVRSNCSCTSTSSLTFRARAWTVS